MNNYREFLNFLNNLEERPRLLLHSCCGPCSTQTIDFLKDYFEITLFYCNSNIFPYEEFQKRSIAQREVLRHFDKIDYLEDQYDYNDFLKYVEGFEKMGEGSTRCYHCYDMRIKRLAEKAIELGYQYYTTTLSISPYKNSKWINEIGKKYESDEVTFLYSDFKKENGYQKSVSFSKKWQIYRQDYCGCEFSRQEHQARNNILANIKNNQ